MDATFSEGLGRLVNDAPHVDANCSMKKIMINGHPRLALFAKEDINPGEELRYDYGIKDLPWRKFKGMPELYLGLLVVIMLISRSGQVELLYLHTFDVTSIQNVK